MDDVVLMVTKGNLGAPQLLSKVKELFAPLPGTEETGWLLSARWNTIGNGGCEAGGDDVEGDGETVAERLEIVGVRFVMNIIHPYMTCLDGEAWHMYLGTTGEKL